MEIARLVTAYQSLDPNGSIEYVLGPWPRGQIVKADSCLWTSAHSGEAAAHVHHVASNVSTGEKSEPGRRRQRSRAC